MLDGVVNTITKLDSDLDGAIELFELAAAELDDQTLQAIEEDEKAMEFIVADLEFRRMFSNPMDPCNCFIDIQAGAGGTEACDWASMLLRQYLRYCERKGFKAEILEESDGDVAGIKSATLKIDGEYAFGFLRTETGVHRLVRKSPLTPQAVDIRPSQVFLSTQKLMTPSKLILTQQISEQIPTARLAQAANILIKRTRQYV